MPLLLALVAVLAGCALAGGAQPAPPGGGAFALPAAFQGQWQGHGRQLTVDRDGSAVMRYRTYLWCTDAVTTGCDRETDTAIIAGGRDEMRFTAVQGQVATGTIRTSTTPGLAGSAVTLTARGDGILDLRQASQPDADWTFCGPNAADASNACGA